MSSKTELINWINSTFGQSLAKLENLSNGVVYCQIINSIDTGVLPMQRVHQKTFQQFESHYNFKLIQQALIKLGIQKNIDIDKLVKGNYQEHIEFASFLRKYIQKAKTPNQKENINPNQQQQQQQQQIQSSSPNLRSEQVISGINIIYHTLIKEQITIIEDLRQQNAKIKEELQLIAEELKLENPSLNRLRLLVGLDPLEYEDEEEELLHDFEQPYFLDNQILKKSIRKSEVFFQNNRSSDLLVQEKKSNERLSDLLSPGNKSNVRQSNIRLSGLQDHERKSNLIFPEQQSQVYSNCLNQQQQISENFILPDNQSQNNGRNLVQNEIQLQSIKQNSEQQMNFQPITQQNIYRQSQQSNGENEGQLNTLFQRPEPQNDVFFPNLFDSKSKNIFSSSNIFQQSSSKIFNQPENTQQLQLQQQVNVLDEIKQSLSKPIFQENNQIDAQDYVSSHEPSQFSSIKQAFKSPNYEDLQSQKQLEDFQFSQQKLYEMQMDRNQKLQASINKVYFSTHNVAREGYFSKGKNNLASSSKSSRMNEDYSSRNTFKQEASGSEMQVEY